MKRIYLLSLWLLSCLVLPMQIQAVSQTDLLNAERFEHIDSSADSGRGDGKYLDLSSVKSKRRRMAIVVLKPSFMFPCLLRI